MKASGVLIWNMHSTARLGELYQTTQNTFQEIADTINHEFGTSFSAYAVKAKKTRMKLPNRGYLPPREEQVAASREATRRFWEGRRRAKPVEPPKPAPVFETVEQFLARGGTITRIELPPMPVTGVPVYATVPMRHAGAP